MLPSVAWLEGKLQMYAYSGNAETCKASMPANTECTTTHSTSAQELPPPCIWLTLNWPLWLYWMVVQTLEEEIIKQMHF